MTKKNKPLGAGMAEICAAFMELEDACGEAVGGAGSAANNALFALEDYLVGAPTDDLTAIAWKARWLARGIANERQPEAIKSLADALLRDVESLGSANAPSEP